MRLCMWLFNANIRLHNNAFWCCLSKCIHSARCMIFECTTIPVCLNIYITHKLYSLIGNAIFQMETWTFSIVFVSSKIICDHFYLLIQSNLLCAGLLYMECTLPASYLCGWWIGLQTGSCHSSCLQNDWSRGFSCGTCPTRIETILVFRTKI